MSENKKYLGMEKNVCFGLSWVLFPFAIVTLAVEKELTLEEKRNLVSSIVVSACATIISITTSIISAILGAAGVYDFSWVFGLLAIVPLVLWIIGLIKNFKGDEWQCPVAYSIACKFVKGEDKEEPKEEKEEEKEEK